MAAYSDPRQPPGDEPEAASDAAGPSKPKGPPLSDAEVLEQALEHWEEAESADKYRALRRADRRFAQADSDNNWAWDPVMLSMRQRGRGPPRPCLTINKAPLHLNQVTNDQRQNRPQGKCRPVSDNGSKDAAEVFDGILRHIDDISDAASAYDTACEHQTQGGLGYFRIVTEYCDTDSFDQEIKKVRIFDPDSVYDDPYIKTPEGCDRRYCFIVEDLSRATFEREYPREKQPTSWKADGRGWMGQDSVRIAEYFCIHWKQRKLIQLTDGVKWADEYDGPEEPLRTRDVDVPTVWWYKLTSFSVLDSREFPSEFIPLLRVVGNEAMIEGERIIKGMIRNAKDAMRMYNYYVSAEAEMIALQPKAPYIGYKGQFGSGATWQRANIDNLPYLEAELVVDPTTGQVLPLPARQPPPMMPSAFTAGKLGAADDIKSTFCQFDPALGLNKGDQSGRAIGKLQTEADTANYHYGNNLAKAVRMGDRIVVGMIPRVYSSRKVARILGEDGKPDLVQLDSQQAEPMRQQQMASGAIQKIYNLGVGKYDVTVTVGPSYTTKRQESQEFMTQLAQADPTLMQKAGDIIISTFDVAGADRIADRVKRFLPPNILQGENDQQDPKQLLMQLQQQQQVLEHGLQNADGMVTQMQQEMAALTAENQKLKVAAASKSDAVAASIQIGREKNATQVSIARMDAFMARIEALVGLAQPAMDLAHAPPEPINGGSPDGGSANQ